jgi:hypothetical protein
MQGEGNQWGLQQEIKDLQKRTFLSSTDKKKNSPPWKPKYLPFSAIFLGRQVDPERAYSRYQAGVVRVFEDID